MIQYIYNEPLAFYIIILINNNSNKHCPCVDVYKYI
jgi:hypothetical protein